MSLKQRRRRRIRIEIAEGRGRPFNPVRFQQRLISAFLARFPDWVPMHGKVTYYDPYRDYTKFKVPEMAKHFGYAYQKEVRIALRPRHKPSNTLEPLFLSVGPMTDYADLVSL